MKKIRLAFLTIILLLSPAALYAFDITVNYDYDTSGFFTVERRTVLEQKVITAFTSRITNTDFSAITPAPPGTAWTNTFWDPGNMNSEKTLTNSSITANKLLIYVGGSDQSAPPGSLGLAAPGWAAVTAGDATWENTVYNRGRSTSYFSPWGGSMSFDTSTSTSWYSGASETVPDGQIDFYSVAIHEMGHVLGIGTADQWTAKLNKPLQVFTGENAVASNGGQNVPTTGPKPAGDDYAHWADGTMSKIPGTGASQEARMTPVIGTGGTRQYFTDLDWAALQDLGWQVAAVPEPGAVALFLIGVPFAAVFRVFLKRR